MGPLCGQRPGQNASLTLDNNDNNNLGDMLENKTLLFTRQIFGILHGNVRVFWKFCE